jgi:formylglycine-generating enzyme required for sulfatase activity
VTRAGTTTPFWNQVHGNVWEWTEDCYHESYNGAPNNGSALTTGDCSRRVVRGGAWNSLPLDRWASAFKFRTDYRRNDIGFQVGRTLTP